MIIHVGESFALSPEQRRCSHAGRAILHADHRRIRFWSDARYIRVEPIGEDVGRNLPIDIGIVADERATMEALAGEMPGMTRTGWPRSGRRGPS
jgi:thiamine pyrophosphate-dependent acetolactate synthase large subunit-like protein